MPCASPDKQWQLKFSYYVLTIAVCLSLALYWFFGIASPYEQSHYALKVVLGFLYLGMGFFFFHTAFPESHTDNKFIQLYLQSHAIWHVFVVLNGAQFYWLTYEYCRFIEGNAD